jgi:hypothetical protein
MAYKTEAARCAAEIRKALKAKGIKASVKSNNYSMGDSVNVKIKEVINPKVMEQIKEEFAIYQYGNFNGMEDIYEYTNCIEQIPQTKYLFIEYDYGVSDEFVEKAKEIVAQRVSDTFDEYEIKREARSVLFGRCAFVKFEEVA